MRQNAAPGFRNEMHSMLRNSMPRPERPHLGTLADRSIPLPKNVLSLSMSQRAWNGVGVDVAEFHCAGRVSHHLCYETETRLSVLLEEVGSPCEPRLREDQPCPIGYMPRHMHFAPAGMEIWGYSADTRFVKDATLTFDLAVLGERLAIELDADAITTPRLRFSDDRIWTLVRLLSDAVNDPDPSTQLYGDGLTAAIAARLFADPPASGASAKGLAPWQLRRVVAYLDAHLPKRVDLAASGGAGGPVAGALQPGVQDLDRNGALSLAAGRTHPARAGFADRHPRLSR